jgi:hypothetical protein
MHSFPARLSGGCSPAFYLHKKLKRTGSAALTAPCAAPSNAMSTDQRSWLAAHGVGAAAPSNGMFLHGPEVCFLFA